MALRIQLAPYVTPDAPEPVHGCPDVARLLSRYLEGDLDRGVCLRIERHVAGCAACTAVCTTLRAALGACARWRDTPVPPHVLEAVRAALRAAVAGGTAVQAMAPARVPRNGAPR